MRGRVVSGGREAVVALRVLGPAGRHAGEGNSSEAVEVEAVIDTGFTGHLTLPRAMVRSLALPRRGFVDVELADGRTTALDVYEARVLWHGRPRPVLVYETGETEARSWGCPCCAAADSRRRSRPEARLSSVRCPDPSPDRA